MNRLAWRDTAIADQVRQHHNLGLWPALRLLRVRHPSRDGDATPNCEFIETCPAVEREKRMISARADDASRRELQIKHGLDPTRKDMAHRALHELHVLI